MRSTLARRSPFILVALLCLFASGAVAPGAPSGPVPGPGPAGSARLPDSVAEAPVGDRDPDLPLCC
ncbi:hypothetical protein SHL15_8495 [Streptomyces hygroscopicus subsp. limoneus]|nr:hypothetical protein SHL15_8495 [Streptomyces hygroscopicus subsp. limoneus]